MIWLKALQSRLITHFFVEQWLLAAQAITSTNRRYFAPSLLLGRDHTQYVCLNLGHVPTAKRASALKHQVELHSQWLAVDYCVCWTDGIAQVWFWDNQEIVAQLSGMAALPPALQKAHVLSEVLYWKTPEADGVFLYRASQGFDLQYWQGGVLRASQWFSAAPGVQQLQRFFRAQGLPIPTQSLAPIEPDLSDEPWPGVAFSGVAQWYEHRSSIVLAAVACSLAIASLQITSIISWSMSENHWLEQTAELEKTASELIGARADARNARIQINQLQTYFNVPDSMDTQLKVYQRLPVSEAIRLQTWERNFDQVSLLIQGQIPDTLSMVRAFERDGMKDVRVEPQASGKYRIQLVLEGYSTSQTE